VLTVVEHHNQGTAAQVVDEVLRRRCGRTGPRRSRPGSAERSNRGRADRFGIGDAGELDQPGTARVLLPKTGRFLDSQAGLAYSPRTDQRHQTA
jgi:hypothetical protein